MKFTIVTKTSSKPFIGKASGFSYAIKIDSLDSNDFPTKPFGRQLDDQRKVKDWIKGAKKTFVGAKGKPTIPEVRRFIKSSGFNEFYAKWKSDSSIWKDDSVELFYKE